MNIAAIDHDVDSLYDLTEKLKKTFAEYNVFSFTNPLDLLKFSKTEHIDILFTDIRLKPIDGYELMKLLQAEQSFLTFIVSGTKQHPDELSWMNINGFYAKPVTIEELTNLHNKIFS